MTDQLQERLWTTATNPSNYVGESEKYQGAILEQYKLYVEMADRISARRSLTNTFFLSLNTAVFALLGVFLQMSTKVEIWLLAAPLLALLVQCAGWFYLVRSYRQLNTAKYRVIGALEERLPASPYWLAEWYELAEGRDRSVYWPLTHLEQWVPITFALVYLFTFAAAVIVR